MSDLWTAQEAARATGGQLINGDQWAAKGVSIDSRSLEPGDLFVALKDARDGHDFLAQAFVSGASAALISDASKAEGLGPALVVADVLDGLRKLGEAARGGYGLGGQDLHQRSAGDVSRCKRANASFGEELQ